MAEPAADAGATLLALYDSALPEIYGYLVRRCGSTEVAEDLTSETFLAAVDAVRRGRVPDLSIRWLVAVARNKLVDHWRARAREERKLTALEPLEPLDEWDVHLDAVRAHDVLRRLGPHHEMVLTLRYLDGLPVPEIAETIDRTVHATEALLVRARHAFRVEYGERSDDV
jgi:RNA polymerase sigma-70 factor, ECF subfamily